MSKCHRTRARIALISAIARCYPKSGLVLLANISNLEEELHLPVRYNSLARQKMAETPLVYLLRNGSFLYDQAIAQVHIFAAMQNWKRIDTRSIGGPQQRPNCLMFSYFSQRT